MTENDREYQFKHPKRIRLRDYRDTTDGLVRINNSVAEGFMQAADMRSDIVIALRRQQVKNTGQVGRAGDAWLLSVGEQDLPTLRTEVRSGLQTCLLHEKLLNGGRCNLPWALAYASTAVVDFYASTSLLAGYITSGANPLEGLLIAGSAATATNFILNSMSALYVEIDSRLTGNSSPNDPFVRHSLPEFFFPPVPLDKLLKGYIYLREHGRQIID